MSKLRTILHVMALLSLIHYISSNGSINQDPIFPMPFKSGYVGVTDVPDQNKTFYFLVSAKDGNKEAPLIIWLNGGPGCSSMGGAGNENGPFYVDPDTNTAKLRKISWNEKADVLYVDQPIGTGFSIAQEEKLAKDGADVKKLFYEFFTKWLELDDFKKYQKRPLYITGESYAGHYIPQIANYFLRQKNEKINLQGIAIGNTRTDRWKESMKYLDFIYYAQEHTKFDDNIYNTVKDKIALYKSLQSQTFTKNPMLTKNKQSVFFELKSLVQSNYNKVTRNKFGFNPYDVRKACLKSGDCNLTHQTLGTFYNKPAVKKALGVPDDKKWIQCNSSVGAPIRAGPDYYSNVSKEYQLILNSGLKTLIYNGTEDSVCDFMGAESTMSHFPWYGNGAFNKIKEFKKGPFGDYKEYQNLKYIRIGEAGHFVPLAQPKIARDMIYDFLGLK